MPTPIQLGGKEEEETLKNFLILPVLIDITENSIRDTAASRSARSRDQTNIVLWCFSYLESLELIDWCLVTVQVL